MDREFDRKKCHIADNHVESFNYLADEGLYLAALDVPTVKLRLPNGDAVEFSYNWAHLEYPIPDYTSTVGQSLELAKIYPSECRQRGLTYAASLRATIHFSVNGTKIGSATTILGEVPVMLMSKHCNLHGFNREQLIRHGEEGSEKGGYFIVNGSERVVRLLVANKRNFPLATRIAANKYQDQLFSDSAVTMHCIRGNFAAAVIKLHYVENASMTLCFQYRRELFYVPLMYVLRALTDMNDAKIYEHLTRGRPGDTFWANCVTNMLRTAQEEGFVSQQAACVALGSRFRVALGDMIAPWEPDEEATHYLLKYCVAIHLNTNEEKFFCLALMALKLIALVKNEIMSESLNNPQFQEVSVSGHIMLMQIREKMEDILTSARFNLERAANMRADTFQMTSNEMSKALKSGKLTHNLRYFLSTGNLITNNGLGRLQTYGLSVIAERINYVRFVSHFRVIHRGSFFIHMRTTELRKLRPEAYGFICPVNTPDGDPCGLLNHLTATCRFVTWYSVTRDVETTLISLGMLPHKLCTLVKYESLYPVIVDGNFLGYIPRDNACDIERKLRDLKVNVADNRIPYVTEITLIRHSPDPTNVMTQFPGLYLYTSPGRLIRPVCNLQHQKEPEFIGIFEQVYLSIIVYPEEAETGVTIHQELDPNTLFSFTANLIPFPDYNQSPRNIYQCQMSKQTMGVPVHAWRHRADNKMYLLQYPQNPLLKLESHDVYGMNDYPLGTNACVALISYTGYDMEDAMVINKSSYQRGFAHGGVVKVERINLPENNDFFANENDLLLTISEGGMQRRRDADASAFSIENNLPLTISDDGLPIPGRLYKKDDIYYRTFDTTSRKYKPFKFKSEEPAYCLSVRIVDKGKYKHNAHALIQWRITRNPVIGDKFSTRQGQKGINSFLWPTESLPFSDSGMVPDIIFNPHGIPSRMTIGMMIESMAGKAAAMDGTTYDGSPFVFDEDNTAIDYFGQLLQNAGFNYHGYETMYSGINGKEMEVQIFSGIVYYQRLRHMIADKYQVRATGPVDPVTLQPVKGRKLGGGIRFGEMERDALIAHGTAFCLQDRLLNCSDKVDAYMCAGCCSLVSVAPLRPLAATSTETKSAFHEHNATIEDINYPSAMKQRCTVCKSDDQVFLVQIPHVLRYLCAELSSVNVKVQFGINYLKNFKH